MTEFPRSPRVSLLYRPIRASMPLRELAQAAQERGFDGICVGEHTHIPISRDSPFPAGGQLPEAYAEFPDPFITLAFIAAETTLDIAVTVSLVAQHDPITLAKTVATLDQLSGGRFTLGVGFGWNREELANHGKSFKDRRAIVGDYVALMRSLWTDDEAEYHGEHVNLERSWSWPKPAQSSIPVLLGSQAGERSFNAILSWADGWIPGAGDTEWLADRLSELRRRWCDAGRSAAGPIVWPMQNAVLTAEELRAQLGRLTELAVHRLVLDIPTASRETVLPLLDEYAKAVTGTR